MAKRRRKPGRPRTGHDPVVTVRLPAVVIGRIGRWAAELGVNRSMIVRLLIEHPMGYGSYKARVAAPCWLPGYGVSAGVAPKPTGLRPER